jgi:Ser/Thr protein kinase RdoA (MazF antagonist)
VPGPFGIDVAGLGDGDIRAALGQLARPPGWLVAIEDPARLRAELERCVPELATGSLRLVSCRFKRAHLGGGTWTSLCRLTVEGPEGDGRREVDVRGTLVLPGEQPPPPSKGEAPLGSEGWRCYLPALRWDLEPEPSDDALPAVALLTDPERSRELLEGALRSNGSGLGDLRLGRSEPTVARYREGRRCTIRYRFEPPPGEGRPDWPEGAVVKVYEGDEGRATFEAMQSLWSTPLRKSPTVRIAEPLGFLPELNALVQGLVPGDRSLKEHIKKAFAGGVDAGVEALAGHVRLAGRGLAELHTSGAGAGPVVTWDGQMEVVRRAAEELGDVLPELAGAVDPLVATLDQAALDVPAGPLVPTHRSFRPAQILVDEDAIAFIDFDGFCQAEAGLDLALFRTTLTDLCLRAMERDGEMDAAERDACEVRLDELCATFIAGYEEVAPVDKERVALWDVLTSVKDILDCWRKIKFEHLDRRTHFIERRLSHSAA